MKNTGLRIQCLQNATLMKINPLHMFDKDLPHRWQKSHTKNVALEIPI